MCLEGGLRLKQEVVGDEVFETFSTTCPWLEVSPFARAFMEMYVDYKNGFLLKAGGIADQPAWYLEAIRFIDNRMNAIQAARLREENG